MGYELDFSAIAENLGPAPSRDGHNPWIDRNCRDAWHGPQYRRCCDRALGPGWSQGVIAVYVELIRNTPFIVQLFFIFFGLPSLGIKLSALQAAALAMTINLTAYGIEIVRAGIEAVPPGQREAGVALGMSPTFDLFRHHSCRRPSPLFIRPSSARSSSPCWNRPWYRRSPSPISPMRPT